MSEQMFGLGCSDGNCRIRDNKGGMHTNGGCKCLRYPEDAEKVKKLIDVARAAQTIFTTGNYTRWSGEFAHFEELNDLEEALKELKGE